MKPNFPFDFASSLAIGMTRLAALSIVCSGLCLLGPRPAVAQDASAASANPLSVEEARELAEQARRAAERAAAEVGAARLALEEAKKRAEEAAAQEEAALAADPVVQATEAAARAEQKAAQAQHTAENASRKARELEARVRELERAAAYDRPGPSLSGGIFYAPEAFDHGLGKSDAEGLYGRLAYRFHSRFALDLRFDLLNKFDAEGSIARGSVEPWAATANARIFLLTGRIQPYLSVGFGAVSARIKGTRFVDGSRFSARKTEAAFRYGGGFDVYLSPGMVLNLDAAYYSPGGDLEDFSFAALGGGLEIRF